MLTEKALPVRRPGFWLMLLFAAQSCLDVLAYWTRNDSATPAGWIRLALLVVLPLLVLLMTEKKKEFFYSFMDILINMSCQKKTDSSHYAQVRFLDLETGLMEATQSST